MLLDPLSWMLASRSEAVLEALDPEVAEHTAAETHGSVVELATSPHATVAEATAELACLRGRLAGTLESLGLAAAVAGTHPLASWEDTEVSPGARYQFVYASMRELARREPTFALHVHVAVPDERAAVRALDGLREELPLLLALSANSPYWQGRDSGLASARIPVFQAFPRTGTPRAFGSYEAYVEAIDVLIRSNAIPEPTFLWWDVRLQPRLGTIEVRIMDAQTRVADTAALVAPGGGWRGWGRGGGGGRARGGGRGPRRWRRRCSRRTASSPRATAWTRASWTSTPAAASPSPSGSRRPCAPARRTRSGWAARPSWRRCTRWPSGRERCASARSPIARRACPACCGRCTATS